MRCPRVPANVGYVSEPKGRGAAWTELFPPNPPQVRGTSDEGPPPQAARPAGRGLEAEAARRPTNRGTELDELYKVSQAVLSVTRQMSVRDVLQVIVRSARSLVGARYAALGVPDEGDSFAEFVVDGISSAEWQAIGPLPRRHGMLAVLLNEGKPERLADIRKDPRFEGWPSAHPQMSHFLGVPVRDGDRVLGIIFAANKTSAAAAGRGFTERDEEILSLFAAHAAIALTNARLYERSRELSVMQERSRLARDLHDAVTQKLFSIRAHARAAAVLAARDPVDAARVRTEIEVVGTLGAEAHAELRAAIDGLAPPDLGAAGLAESLRRYAVLAGAGARGPGHVHRRRSARARSPGGGGALPGRSGGAAQRVAARRSGRRPGRPVDSTIEGPAPGRPRGVRRRSRVRARGAVRRAGAGLDAGARGGRGRRADHPVGEEGNPGADDRAVQGRIRHGGRRKMTGPISVLIVDDHPVVRRGLRVLLEVQDGIEVAARPATAPRRSRWPPSTPRT